MRTHHTPLQPTGSSAVTIDSGFWGDRQNVLRKTTLPSQHRHLESTGRIAALDPDHLPGDEKAHHKFWDSDIAKWMEAACISLATHPDGALSRQVEDLIEAFERLQQDDGYLNIWFLKVHPDRRWTNLRDDHELYCAGHLLEAAVAHQLATGSDRFVNLMRRYIDYIATVFGVGDGQKQGYPGHEEIELALVKLFDLTGERRYLDLSRYFIDERGKQPHYFAAEAEARDADPYPPWGEYQYYQAHVPGRKQNKATGHAVRAMYLYAGMADLHRLTGDRSLEQALGALWDNVVNTQMYITGSVGAAGHGERFTFDYDLPEETSYCETCAAIGLIFWGHRLLGVRGDGQYADVIERALYNGVLSGISLEGDRYFYVNPLASLGNHHRQDWFGCACCPPNIARLIAGIGGYIYAGGDEAWINQFTECSGQVEVGGRSIDLSQKTQYPWDGRIEITVDPAEPREFVLNLRIPGWCSDASVTVNNESVDLAACSLHGYAHLERTWSPGDTIVLNLPMPVRRVYANPNVRMANGKVALQRGPIVYCVEETDNPVTPLTRISLPRDGDICVEQRRDLFGGVPVLKAEAAVQDPQDDRLYGALPPSRGRFALTAVPYFLWDNRDPGQMLVWLRED